MYVCRVVEPLMANWQRDRSGKLLKVLPTNGEQCVLR